MSADDFRFNVIYSDNPWKFGNVRTGGNHRSGSAQKYAVLSVQQLAEIDLGIVARDAVLFSWTPVAMVPEAIALMRAWGFTYKTVIHWHKIGRYGTGYWLRGDVEYLMLGVRGHVPAFRSSTRNWVDAPVERHSKKPDIFRRIIESVTERTMPDRRFLELFARGITPITGWTLTGLEFDGVDILDKAWWTHRRFGRPLPKEKR